MRVKRWTAGGIGAAGGPLFGSGLISINLGH